MLSYGMFMDGVVYASIARNMAENYGSFWQPYYTATAYPIFYQHPPLGFWLQSWAYRLCGDSVYVEAWWGFAVGMLILLVLAGIWRCLTPQGYAVAGAWFPIMLFIVMPMTSWAVANNMLENMMTFFILLAVLLCLLSLKNSTIFFSCLYGILSGLSMFCAILIKGPVALFPLAVPCMSIMHDAKKIIKVSTTTIILLITLVVSFGLILSTNTASLHFFKRYVSQQVMTSVTGASETWRSHFAVLTVVSRESLVPLLVGGTLAATLYHLRQTAISPIHARLFLYYLGIALAGSLPILISVKQMRWYAFPSLPFYAMAIAVIFNDAALALERLVNGNKNIEKNIIVFSLIILCIAVCLMFIEKNTPGRDKDFYTDFSKKDIALEERKIISVYPSHLATNWTLVANMQRKFRASLSEQFGQEYLLTTTDYMNSEHISSHYKRIDPFNTKKYVFFKLHD
jgi:4-amino-4-deoxy-L-arabinose transferase-like glycosyltransferase